MHQTPTSLVYIYMYNEYVEHPLALMSFEHQEMTNEA